MPMKFLDKSLEKLTIQDLKEYKVFVGKKRAVSEKKIFEEEVQNKLKELKKYEKEIICSIQNMSIKELESKHGIMLQRKNVVCCIIISILSKSSVIYTSVSEKAMKEVEKQLKITATCLGSNYSNILLKPWSVRLNG